MLGKITAYGRTVDWSIDPIIRLTTMSAFPPNGWSMMSERL